MSSYYEQEYSPPPSPSPAPRLRRSPKRLALHERTNSHTNQQTYPHPTIRPITDADAKVYATSPFPNAASQVFAPRGRDLLAPKATTSGSASPIIPVPNLSEPNPNPTFATPKVRDQDFSLNASIRPHVYNSSSHNGPRPEPTSAHSRPFSYPPGEVQSSSPITPLSYGIDVDRLAMVEGSNVNNDYLGVPSHLTPFAGRHGLSQSSPITPQTSSTTNRSGLGAIATVASDLSFDSTPMSVGSAASNGTVIRKRGFTGPVPPGFFSLFPPVPTPQSGSSRYDAVRPRRSSSAPPRPVSEGPLSPISTGTQSPVSPMSDSDDSARSSPRHSRSRSESLLQTPDRQYPVLQFPSGSSAVESVGSGQYEPESLDHLIPRKPVSRSNAVRWNSYMSTIPSESEPDTRSSLNRSSANKSELSTGRREEFRRSSSALPPPLEPDELPSGAIDFATLDTAFPLPEPLQVNRRSRQRISSTGSTIRVVSESMGSIPNSPPRRIGSPTSIYSRPEYRDSGSQTDAATILSKRGSWRENLPTWARYSNNFSNCQPQVSNEPVPGSYSHFINLNFGSSISCPNCSARWSPDVMSNLNQFPSHYHQKEVKFADDTTDSSRFYYANERKNRETIGRPLSRISSSSSRRHTISSLYEYPDSIQVVRNKQLYGPRPQSRLDWRRPQQQYVPSDRLSERSSDRLSDRPVSMPITPASPIDRSVFIGESIRGSIRDRSSWSPHLWYSRQSAFKRRTLFLEPSIDEEAEGKGLTKRNLQIWCFALGFIFPFSKFFSFLFFLFFRFLSFCLLIFSPF
jgi:hypothetical protein